MITQETEFFFIEDTRDVPEMDIAFALSAAAVDADDIFENMKATLDTIIKYYGIGKMRYAVMTFGSTSSVIVNFGDGSKKDDLRTTVQQLSRPAGDPNITDVLQEAESLFENAPPRPVDRKVLVIFIDKKSVNSLDDIEEATKPLFEKNITIIPAVVGSAVDMVEIEVLPENRNEIAICPVPKPETWPGILIDKATKGEFWAIGL